MKWVTFLAKNILVSVAFVFILTSLKLQGQTSLSNCVQNFDGPILTFANESAPKVTLTFKITGLQSEEETRIVDVFSVVYKK